MARCACRQCGQEIDFPEGMVGQKIACPICGKDTVLSISGAPTIRLPRNVHQRPLEREPGTNPVFGIAQKIVANVEKVVLGKRAEVTLALAAFFAEGHVLLEDVPGVAKTMLARAIAQSVGCHFKRVQCTPDLLPSEITGASIFNPKTTEFEFRPGPIFAEIVLADEINRATPRTQAALLEAMSERQVTSDGVHYDLKQPFFIIATQNPIDHEGTFPLPEAQLDRFLLRLSLGYPSFEDESGMLQRFKLGHPIESLVPVVTSEEVLGGIKAVREIHVDAKVVEYILRLVRATRESDAVRLGGSPRASLALFRAAQAVAAIQGFDYVLPDDVKQVAPAVLTHRLILKPESRLRKLNAAGVVAGILNQVEVPSGSMSA